MLASLAFVGVPARSCAPAVRAVIEEAWLQRAPLWMRYDGGKGVTERRVRVESAVIDRAEILLNCDDLDLSERRQFKLHRVLEARVERATCPA